MKLLPEQKMGMLILDRLNKKLPAVILGLDLGVRHVGISISDKQATTASMLTSYETKAERLYVDKNFGDLIQKILYKHSVNGIIFGLPEKPQITVNYFKRVIEYLQVEREIRVPFTATSEDYTTQAAKMASYELSQMTGVFVGEKKMIDKIAATMILQSFLDLVHQDPNRLKKEAAGDNQLDG